MKLFDMNGKRAIGARFLPLRYYPREPAFRIWREMLLQNLYRKGVAVKKPRK